MSNKAHSFRASFNRKLLKSEMTTNETMNCERVFLTNK